MNHVSVDFDACPVSEHNKIIITESCGKVDIFLRRKDYADYPGNFPEQKVSPRKAKPFIEHLEVVEVKPN